MPIDLSKFDSKELQEIITRANARLAQLAVETVKKLREKFEAEARAHGIHLDELFGKNASRRGGARGTVAPKYQNPGNPSQTWSGRGKRPNWFKDQLAKGRKEQDMLIK